MLSCSDYCIIKDNKDVENISEQKMFLSTRFNFVKCFVLWNNFSED